MKKQARVTLKDKDNVKHYDVPVQNGMTLLGALLEIQMRIDSKVAFRWNCRTGQCGICAVFVNGNPKLACTERVLPDNDYLVEPILEGQHIQSLVCDIYEPCRQYFLKSRYLAKTEVERKCAFKTAILKYATMGKRPTRKERK